MEHYHNFRGTGEGDACFIAEGAPVYVFENNVEVHVTLNSREAEAYRQRYNPQLHVQADGGWFEMQWMGDDGPQVRLIILPDVAKATQDTMEADALARRAVHRLGRLLRGEE